MCQAIREMIQDGREEGIREGIRKGILINKKEVVLSLSAIGMSTEKIAEVVRVSVALVRDWLSGKDE